MPRLGNRCRRQRARLPPCTLPTRGRSTRGWKRSGSEVRHPRLERLNKVVVVGFGMIETAHQHICRETARTHILLEACLTDCIKRHCADILAFVSGATLVSPQAQHTRVSKQQIPSLPVIDCLPELQVHPQLVIRVSFYRARPPWPFWRRWRQLDWQRILDYRRREVERLRRRLSCTARLITPPPTSLALLLPRLLRRMPLRRCILRLRLH
jgi:hypothetical protein